jgi:type I restriction enzyme S subunit
MEVATKNRIGYKKTKLGWIPEDWSFTKLGNLGQFLKGKGVAKSEIIEAGIPCVRYGEIYTYHNDYIKAFTSFISEESANQSIKLEVGDILFAGSGETQEDIGKSVAFVDEFEAYAGGDIIILRGHDQDPKFLGFLLNSDFVSRQTFQLGQGHSVVHIYSSGLKDVKIPLPPLLEQQKIAAILSTWDKGIDTLNKLISEKEQLKKGLMQQLLTGKKRFAGFTDEWKEVKLGEVFSLSSGKIKPNNTIAFKTLKMNIPVYGGNGISGYTNEFSNSGDLILIGRVGEYCGAVHFVKEKCWITDNCLWVNNFSLDDDTLFFFYLLSKLNLGRLRNKGGQPLVSQKPILNLNIAKPKLIEQQMIAAVLSAADKEIALLKQELTNLTDQKKGLMQKLLTGEVRVKN